MKNRLYASAYGKGYGHNKLKNTYKKVINFLEIKKSDRVLEIGCGDGFFLRKLMPHSAHIMGIDLNEEAIKNAGLENCMFMDAAHLAFNNNFFDKIYAIHTIEHIPDLQKTFFEMSRCLKKNGKIILVYPFEPIKGLTEFFSSLRVFGHPFRGGEFHLHKLSPGKIKNIAKAFTLKVVRDGLLFADFGPYPQFFSILEKE